jgi:hypothetical protein
MNWENGILAHEFNCANIELDITLANINNATATWRCDNATNRRRAFPTDYIGKPNTTDHSTEQSLS